MLKNGSRKYAIVVISLMMVFLTIGLLFSFLNESFIESISFVLLLIVGVSGLFTGILKIKIFKDYNNSYKLLCVDGVSDILVTILTIVGFIYFPILVLLMALDGLTTLLYVLFGICLFYALYKILISINEIKNKHKGFYFNLIIGICWIFNGLIFLFMDTSDFNNLIYIGLTSANSILFIAIISNIYFRYIKNKPDYLIKETIMND